MTPDTLLIVDDNPDNLFTFSQVIKQYLPELQLQVADHPNKALEIAQNKRLIGALIDVQMPTMDGIELCRQLKEDPTNNIPVILITAHRSTAERKAQGLAAGADDFITRPIDNVELVARIQVMIRMSHAERALQGELAVSQARGSLFSAMLSGNGDLKGISQQLLSASQRLTQSRHGYIALYTDSPSGFTIQAGTSLARSLEDALSQNGSAINPLAIDRPCFYNGLENNPLATVFNAMEGVERFLTVPLRLNQQVIGQVAVAGGLQPYSESSLIAVMQLAAIYNQAIYRCRQEERNAQLAAQLRESQKIEALGTLAGGIAHDFNNILLAVNGYAELVRDSLAPDSENVLFLDEVLKASDRAKGLVQQILTFIRPSKEMMEDVDIKALVNDVLSLLRHSFPSTIEVDVDMCAEPVHVHGDSSQLHQVLLNLGTNALHAMEGKGGRIRIVLEAMNESHADSFPEALAEDKSFVRLTMVDSGTGMTPEVRERIFDPYFTTKETGKGTGLGLSVVHGIVKGHGGAIHVESEPNQGTRFDIYLPAGEAIEADALCKYVSTLDGNEHVLLVDDEGALVKMWRMQLERLGYKVTAFSCSREAMNAIQNGLADVDLMLTDQTMPGFSGLELAAEATRLKPELPVVIMTGFSKKLDKDTMAQAGICEVVLKPLSVQRMVERLRIILDNPDTKSGMSRGNAH